MVWKNYVFQQKFVAYKVGINKNFCISSFLVLSASIEAHFNFFLRNILKVPLIYLHTLVSMSCKYRSYNSSKLNFFGGGGAKIMAIKGWGALAIMIQILHCASEFSHFNQNSQTFWLDYCLLQ